MGKCPRCKSTNLKILHYKCNYSSFQKPRGQWHSSNYSVIECKDCGQNWRTKAKYVDELPNTD